MNTCFEHVKKNFGFGCMCLPMKDGAVDKSEMCRMVDTFLENEFNYFDTAHGYLGGKSETAVEMITFCFLAAQGGCELQLTSHAAANMKIGNDKAFLIKVISQCLPYIGYPRSLNALRCVNEAEK